MAQMANGLKIFLFADYSGALLPVIRDRLETRGHEIVGILTAPPPKSRPNANDFMGVVHAGAELGIPVIVSSKRKGWASLLRTFAPDLCICVGLVWKIPADVLTVPRLGTINTHLGWLPQYRGPHPVGWAFRNDEGCQGVSIHFMAPEWDSGAVLAQTKVPYDDDTEIDALMAELVDEAFRMFDLALERLENGESGEEQDESNAGHAPFFEPEWRWIDWAQPSRFIHNQVRSWCGFRDSPRGAIGTVDGENLSILRTRLVSGVDADGAIPGAVLSRDTEGILIQCGDGPLRIIEWERVEPDQ